MYACLCCNSSCMIKQRYVYIDIRADTNTLNVKKKVHTVTYIYTRANTTQSHTTYMFR